MYIYKVFYNIKSSYKAETYFVMGKKKIPSIPTKAELVTETEERRHIFHLFEMWTIQNNSSKRSDLFFCVQ